MFDKFTESSRQAVLKAQEYVKSKHQQDVQVAHLLMGLMDVEDSLINTLLKKVGVNLGELTDRLSIIMETYPKVYGVTSGSHLSKEASQAIQSAQHLSKDFGDEYVAMDMILAGIFTVTHDKTTKLLKSLGANEKEIGAAIKEYRKGKQVKNQTGNDEFDSLNKMLLT